MATVYVISVVDDNEQITSGDVESVLSKVTDDDLVITTTGRVLFAPSHDVEAIG